MITAAVAGYTQWWIPNRKLADVRWFASAPNAEIKRVAHQVLRVPFGNHHDAFLTLESVGDQTSVPLLISALRWEEHTKSPSDGMICTKAHCLHALRRLTGQDAGVNYGDWKRWWSKQKDRQ